MRKWLDKINWNIATLLKHGINENNAFGNLIVPATVAFLTAIATVVWLH